MAECPTDARSRRIRNATVVWMLLLIGLWLAAVFAMIIVALAVLKWAVIYLFT